MSNDNQVLFTRLNAKAKKFFEKRAKKHGSFRKYILHLLVEDGYEISKEDL